MCCQTWLRRSPTATCRWSQLTTALVGISIARSIVEFAPNPLLTKRTRKIEKGEPSRKYSSSEPFSAYCFHTIADPFAGRINVIKVTSGKVATDATVYNSSRGASERLGALHSIQGKQLDKVPEANAGDIVACVKLKETQTGDTLCDKAHVIIYDPVQYPEAAIALR